MANTNNNNKTLAQPRHPVSEAETRPKKNECYADIARWAEHALPTEHNIWRALILYVGAGALQEALASLHETQQPDTAAMFILACHEKHAEIVADLGNLDDESSSSVKD